MQVAAFQKQLSQAHRSIVGVGEERILDHHARPATSFEHSDKVLEEQERGLTGANREVLLDFLSLPTTKRWICQDDIKAVLLLNVFAVIRQGVAAFDPGCFDAMQNHVHNCNDVR